MEFQLISFVTKQKLLNQSRSDEEAIQWWPVISETKADFTVHRRVFALLPSPVIIETVLRVQPECRIIVRWFAFGNGNNIRVVRTATPLCFNISVPHRSCYLQLLVFTSAAVNDDLSDVEDRSVAVNVYWPVITSYLCREEVVID